MAGLLVYWDMRIKPYAVLGLATLCAGASLAIIVTTSDPYTAEPAMVWLFWAALLLSVWGFVATVFSAAGQRLAVALSNGLFWAAGVVSLAFLSRQGIASARLSAAIILATILLSFVLWWYSRRSAHVKTPNTYERKTHHN